MDTEKMDRVPDGYKRESDPYIGDQCEPTQEKVDPWAHRALGLCCATCMWYINKGVVGLPSTATDLASMAKQIGRCRRHAPTMSGYPVVYLTDWCGDHKLDETKV